MMGGVWMCGLAEREVFGVWKFGVTMLEFEWECEALLETFWLRTELGPCGLFRIPVIRVSPP